jgi:hypothetical protein
VILFSNQRFETLAPDALRMGVMDILVPPLPMRCCRPSAARYNAANNCWTGRAWRTTVTPNPCKSG